MISLRNTGFLLLIVLVLLGTAQAQRLGSDWRCRVPATVAADGVERIDRSIVAEMDFSRALTELEISGDFDKNSLRVVEVDENGTIIDRDVPFQFDTFSDYKPSVSQSKGEIVIFMEGTTAPDESRTFQVHFDVSEKGIAAAKPRTLVELKGENVLYPKEQRTGIVIRGSMSQPLQPPITGTH